MKCKPWQSDNSLNPKCTTCGNHQETAIMRIVKGPCWKCGQPMRVAMVRANGTLGPDQFTPQQIEFAEHNGVILKEHYSKSSDERYLANTCACGQFAGRFYLFKNYWNPAECGMVNHQLITEINKDFFYCEYCEEARFNGVIN